MNQGVEEDIGQRWLEHDGKACRRHFGTRIKGPCWRGSGGVGEDNKVIMQVMVKVDWGFTVRGMAMRAAVLAWPE